MKYLSLITCFCAVILAGCGGGNGGGGSQNATDISGNWYLTGQGQGHAFIFFGAVFNKVGQTVSAHNITNYGASNCPAQVALLATFSNGLVQNGTFSGQMTMTDQASSAAVSTFSFTTTINSTATQFVGNYDGVPCVGMSAGGIFSGTQVPVSGNWSGSFAPCNLDSKTGDCGVTGPTAGTITLSLTLNNSDGVVTGTYQISGVTGLSSGTVASLSADFSGFVSGVAMHIQLTDTSGSKFFISGDPVSGPGTNAGLGLDRTFKGLLSIPNGGTYLVTMSH